MTQLPEVELDLAVITITHDRTDGEVTVDIGTLDRFSAWSLVEQCAQALAAALPEVRLAESGSAPEPDEGEASV